MIEIRLIPDGMTSVPVEAKSHSVLADCLEDANNILDDVNAPINGWRDVERVVPGNGECIVLRVPGTVGDYPSNSLDGIQSAVAGNINGLKAHPSGWTEVEEFEV